MDASIADLQDGSSDYGSDLTPDEVEILNGLLQQPAPKVVLDVDLLLADIEDDENPPTSRAKFSAQSNCETGENIGGKGEAKISIEIESKHGDVSSTNLENYENAARERTNRSEPESLLPDLRSPLERFRKKPRKPLSVTDLISPSWCELQYWYILTKHGKKKSTPAMRRGSKVHQTLEDQVHRTVAMDVQTKEEAWGLRIWNIIQGLQTLRETGMTRELEVWGIIDGQVVNGVIDELSYICPDRGMEETSSLAQNSRDALPAEQTTITSFLRRQSGTIQAEDTSNTSLKRRRPDSPDQESEAVIKHLRSLQKKTSQIYLTDVKTRSESGRPMPQGASFRPTVMQLMLYYRLLSDLATNKVDPKILFDRHNLDPERPFGDAFITQIAAISAETFYDAPSPSSTSAAPSSSSLTIPQDMIDLLLTHNSLRTLWALMKREFALTMPNGTASIGKVLKVEYRGQSDGAVLGLKMFLFDDNILSTYLEDGLRWWKGEREARGVCIEEAYKCGFCEFADECKWRKNKVEEAVRVHRQRTKSVV